jgi:hypothetical protein
MRIRVRCGATGRPGRRRSVRPVRSCSVYTGFELDIAVGHQFGGTYIDVAAGYPPQIFHEEPGIVIAVIEHESGGAEPRIEVDSFSTKVFQAAINGRGRCVTTRVSSVAESRADPTRPDPARAGRAAPRRCTPPASRSQQVGPAADVHLDLDVLDRGGQKPPPSPGGLLPCHRRLGVDRLRAARRSEQHPRQYSYPFRRPVARVRDDPRLPSRAGGTACSSAR